jgi:hypothetical protein
MSVDLRLQGIAGNPVPVGRIGWQGVEVVVPAESMLTSEGELLFFPDMPGEAFILAETAGFVSDIPFMATAFGPLKEGKWRLREGDPQSQFLLLRDGMPRWIPPAASSAPASFFLLADRNGSPIRPIPLDILDHSLEGDGMKFTDSMDFHLSGSILPAGSFRSGYQWKWTPAF